jgi:hypothetical protein
MQPLQNPLLCSSTPGGATWLQAAMLSSTAQQCSYPIGCSMYVQYLFFFSLDVDVGVWGVGRGWGVGGGWAWRPAANVELEACRNNLPIAIPYSKLDTMQHLRYVILSYWKKNFFVLWVFHFVYTVCIQIIRFFCAVILSIEVPFNSLLLEHLQFAN